MSDIHGCYDDMIKMLEQIAFSDEDTLILAGDYIDRGSQSFEMLKWIESNPKNVIFLRGNHDEDMDCTFYDIDCWCASRSKRSNAKLTCLRLDDEQIFYV